LNVGSLSVRFHREGEILVAGIAGLLTVETVRQLRRLVGCELRNDDARAIVMDTRRAVRCFDQEAWLTVAQESQRDHRIEQPIAIVINRRERKAIEAHCVRMARRGQNGEPGLLRVVTSSLDDALWWSSSRQEYWAHPPAVSAVSG